MEGAADARLRRLQRMSCGDLTVIARVDEHGDRDAAALRWAASQELLFGSGRALVHEAAITSGPAAGAALWLQLPLSDQVVAGRSAETFARALQERLPQGHRLECVTYVTAMMKCAVGMSLVVRIPGRPFRKGSKRERAAVRELQNAVFRTVVAMLQGD